MRILVDSSVWIDYFRGGNKSAMLDKFIDENIICTNYLILSELIPALKINKKNKLINLIHEITKVELRINWTRIIDLQILCLQNGINKVGIPDLMIVDNVIEHDLILFSLDKHFVRISNYLDLKLVEF